MKRLFVVMVFLAYGLYAHAQIDTLFVGDRDPKYYFWDTNWWDQYVFNYPEKEAHWYHYCPYILECKPEFARYIYTDTPMRVIGVAVVAQLGNFMKNRVGTTLPDTFYYNKMAPEYFRLYEVDSTDNDMHFVTEGKWTYKGNPIVRYMQTTYDNPPWGYGEVDFHPIYEAYFNKPVIVYDSFYVSVTGNNCYWPAGVTVNSSQNLWWATLFPTTIGPFYRDDPSVFPKPNHYRRKVHLFDEDNVDTYHGVTDTNWHTFANYSIYAGNPWVQYMCFFPIIDTSFSPDYPPCGEVDELTLAYANNGVVTVSWTGEADQWQLSVCPGDCAPEDGTISTWTTTVATLTGLDTAQWYTVRVRSVCNVDDSTYYGNWSRRMYIYVSGDANIGDVAYQNTYLMPNPATETVTIHSSFRISEVEVFSLEGRSLMKRAADGNSITLDIKALASASYMVRIATDKGITFKKLVVR